MARQEAIDIGWNMLGETGMKALITTNCQQLQQLYLGNLTVTENIVNSLKDTWRYG